MKKSIPLLTILIFAVYGNLFAQNQAQQVNRRNCSYIGRPIIDLAGGVVVGKAIKIAKPRLNDAAKRFSQNAVVSVKIEIDENGNVLAANAEGRIPILRNVSVQAARKTKFSPTLVEGVPIKIKGQIVYRFYQGKAHVSYSFEPVKYEPTPIDYDGIKLVRMFDSKIVSAIEDFREGKKMDAYSFVENGNAKIQLCMTTKKPEIVEKIKQTGFNLLEEAQGNGLVGQIPLGNLTKLADIEEIRFIVPEP